MDAKEKKAQDWFNQNYHTPMNSFLANYGVPVLHGVYDDGQQYWEDIPIGKVLKAYHQHKSKEIQQQNQEQKDMLLDAKNQIEYLHKKFKETGSGNAVIARIEALTKEK